MALSYMYIYMYTFSLRIYVDAVVVRMTKEIESNVMSSATSSWSFYTGCHDNQCPAETSQQDISFYSFDEVTKTTKTKQATVVLTKNCSLDTNKLEKTLRN